MNDWQKNKIRITYIMPSAAAGGAERFLLDLISNLDLEKFVPSLILFDHGGFFLKDFAALGMPVVVLQKKYKFDLGNFCKLRQALKKLKPDIVHTQLGGDVYGRLVARCLGVKKIISTEQNVQVHEDWLANKLKTWTAKFANKIVAISEAVKVDSLKRYQLPPEKLIVIPNGVDVQKFFIKPRALTSPGKIILGSVGRLTEQKNFSFLIKALANFKDKNFECLIAGEGELRKDLQTQIDSLELGQKIKLVGLQKDIPVFLQQLDVFILPSLWEGLGIVALEAGLTGLPVLAARVDGLKEIIKDEATGWLFDPQDEKDLAAKLSYVFDFNNREILKDRGRKLQVAVLERFDIKNIVRQYEKLYFNL